MSTVPAADARLATAIPNLLLALDESLGDDLSLPALLLMFEPNDGGLSFGTKQLPAGMHPLDELMGFVAPDSWAALGTVCHGWGSRDMTQRPSKAPDRVRLRAVHVVCRSGDEVGGFRFAGDALELQPASVGMVPDALRRALGLPTTPPDFPAAELMAADWMDTVADRALNVKKPPNVDAVTWDDIRWQVVTGERTVNGLTPTLAGWMDEGIFARWMRPTYPHAADQLAAVRRVVDRRTYDSLRRALESWGLID